MYLNIFLYHGLGDDAPAKKTAKASRRTSTAGNESEKCESAGDLSGSHDGRWTKEEQDRFIEALGLYGKNWKKVQAHVGSRTTTQVRSHAQKYFAKLGRKVSTAKGGEPSVNEAESSSEVKSVSEGAKTQASTPIDSPLGGPCPIEKSSPKSKCVAAVPPVKELSATVPAATIVSSCSVTKAALKRAIVSEPLSPIEPMQKVKVVCAAPEERFVPHQQQQLYYPPMPYHHMSLPLPMYESQFVQHRLQPQLLPQQQQVPTSYYKYEPQTYSTYEYTFNTEFNNGTTGAYTTEGNCEAESAEQDGFFLDCPPILPLDLQAQDEPPMSQPASTFNENVKTDFSGIFS